jgi:hypothetical protein
MMIYGRSSNAWQKTNQKQVGAAENKTNPERKTTNIHLMNPVWINALG